MGQESNRQSSITALERLFQNWDCAKKKSFSERIVSSSLVYCSKAGQRLREQKRRFARFGLFLQQCQRALKQWDCLFQPAGLTIKYPEVVKRYLDIPLHTSFRQRERLLEEFFRARIPSCLLIHRSKMAENNGGLLTVFRSTGAQNAKGTVQEWLCLCIIALHHEYPG